MEPVPLPIACSLGPDDAAARRDEWHRLAERALIDCTRAPGRVRLRFRALAGVRSSLEQLVVAERECCPFLHLVLGEDDSGLLLEISGPPEADAVLDLFAEPSGVAGTS